MTFEELQAILGYDALAPMYADLGGQGNPFYFANEEGGPGQYLGVQGAQMYNGFDPGFFAPYDFQWNQSGPGNSGTVSAFKDGNQLGQWSQYDTPTSETLRDGLLTAGLAFGGLGLAGAGPFGGMLGGGAAGGTAGTAAGTAGGLEAASLGAIPEFGAGVGALGDGMLLSGGGVGIGGGAGLAGGGAGMFGGLGELGKYFGSGQGLLSLGGNLLSGYMQNRAAGKSTDALLQAGRESNELQKYMYDTARGDFAPYREAGTTALGQIQNLLADPSAITKQADYKFGLDQGRNALENSASARGMTYSGAQSKALNQFGQDYAGSKLNESYNRLAGIAGIGQQATNSTTSAGMNYGNQAGNTLQNMGNARASGYIGQSNGWGNAFGNILKDYEQQQANQNVPWWMKPPGG
jgi:hypothetical protein